MADTPKPTLYCQMGFIEKFLALLTNPLDVLLGTGQQSADVYTACFRLLFGPAHLVVNLEPASLMAHPNPMVKKLWKNGAASVQCRAALDQEIADDSFWSSTPSAVFLLDVKAQAADEFEKNWGVLVLTPDNLLTKGQRLLPNPPMFLRRSAKDFNWKLLANQKHCFHSVIIADNYINSNIHQIRNNLVPLIQTILSSVPQKRHLHITLVTLSDDVEAIHRNLLNILDQHQIRCELLVVRTLSLENHDRHLITNQRWIFSGFGFNILRFNYHEHAQEVTRDTTLLCMPTYSGSFVTMQTDDDAIPEGSTYYGAAAAIRSRLESIANQTPEYIGTQRRTAGNHPQPVT